MRSRLSLLGAAFLSCCSGSNTLAPEGPVPDVEGLALERMFAVFAEPGPGAIFGGFSGAASPGQALEVLDGSDGVLAQAQADASGRFRAEFSPPVEEAEVAQVYLRRAGTEERFAFRIRRAADARAAAVGAPIGGAGSTPNDLVITGQEEPLGLLIRSGDNAVNAISLQDGIDPDRPGVRLPAVPGPNGDVVANPFYVAPLSADGQRVAVTAFNQRRIYVVDMERAEVEQTLEVTQSVELASPFSLLTPWDIDGDGNQDGEIRRFVPRSPQAVLAYEGALYVGFSGFVTASIAGRPPVYVPSVVAVWQLDALDQSPALYPLPTLNLQELRGHGSQILAVCSGVVDPLVSPVEILTESAVYLLEPDGSIARAFNLGSFGAGTALIEEEQLWVGSLVEGRLLRINLMDELDVQSLVLNDEEVDSVFRLVSLDGGLIGAPSFNTDRLHIVDAVTSEMSPAPFYEPLSVGPGRPVFDGLQLLARRPGRIGVDFQGPDLFALSSVASRITPVELRRILGP